MLTIETPVQETYNVVDEVEALLTSLLMSDETSQEETCYLCGKRAVYHCYVCDKPICGIHTTRLPQWCAFHHDACPDHKHGDRDGQRGNDEESEEGGAA